MTNKYYMAFKLMLREVTSYIKKNYRLLLEVLLFVETILIIFFLNDQNRIIWMILLCFTFSALILLPRFFSIVKEIQKPMKRFTKKTKEGDIFVEEERLHQALIYLSILEDQLEQQ